MLGNKTQPSPRPRPILKWAGGKGQLLPQLIQCVPNDFDTYHEPFIGGGALFFELTARGKIAGARLSDINPSLIEVYCAVRDHVEEVIEALRGHRNDREYYYSIRAQETDKLSLPERAARIIYLNKTCYNGLYRENRSGQFNVPFGRYKNPTICNETNLRTVSRHLQSVDISCRPFFSVLEVAHRGDFVYFDPPYHPVSPTANFTSYERNGFGKEDQSQLRETFAELERMGVKAVLSNSDTPFVRELYAEYEIFTVHASRAVNSKASSRGKVPEVIVCNFDLPEEAKARLLHVADHSGLIPKIPNEHL